MEDLNLVHVRPEEIGDDDPLFGDRFGLDSIDAVELVFQLKKHFGVVIKNQSDGPLDSPERQHHLRVHRKQAGGMNRQRPVAVSGIGCICAAGGTLADCMRALYTTAPPPAPPRSLPGAQHPVFEVPDSVPAAPIRPEPDHGARRAPGLGGNRRGAGGRRVDPGVAAAACGSGS